MTERLIELGKKYARLVTRAVVARPWAWRLFRGPLRAQFQWLAPHWEARRSPQHLSPLATALERLDAAPARILDVGTGTGLAARYLAERYPSAAIVGVDLAPNMVAEAGRLLPPELQDRVTFAVADAAALPYRDGQFDLVTLVAAIPFFAELGRVTAPGGAVAIVFPSGAQTPIYAPPGQVRRGLERAGFEGVEHLEAGSGTAILARRH